MRNSKIPKLLKSKILEPVAYLWRSLKKVPEFQNHERDVLDLGWSAGVQKNNYETFQKFPNSFTEEFWNFAGLLRPKANTPLQDFGILELFSEFSKGRPQVPKILN